MGKNRQNKTGLQVLVVVLLLTASILTGCGNDDDTPTAAPPTPDTAAIAVTAAPRAVQRETPTPVNVQSSPVETPLSSASYPAPEQISAALTGYPAPRESTPETSRISIVPFVLERPLEPGATIVRGTGPANVPIVIANVFLMGEIIGEGIIGADGRFEVTVVPPLEKGHWIGIALDNLSDTEFTYEDFYAQGFRGPGAEQVPQVGFIYDSEYVQ